MDLHDPHSAHRRAWDAIPWFVAGSASPEDVALLQNHLSECAACRDELRFQEQVQDALRSTSLTLPDPSPGLQRLLARIEAGDDASPPAADAARGSRALTRWLTAAVLVQAVGLGLALLALREQRRDGDFQTLSQPAPAAPVAELLLVPGPGLDFVTLGKLLTEARWMAVDVAPDAGSLHLAPRDKAAVSTAVALQRLRTLPGVLLVEPTAHGH